VPSLRTCQSNTWKRRRPTDKPPKIDGKTLLVVDEASMCDLGQMDALTEHLEKAPGAQLLLIGDDFQLPPIGMGLVFHRLAAMDSITARLGTVHRQPWTSGIPSVAASVRACMVPALAPYAGPADGVFLLVPNDGESLEAAIARVADDLGGFAGDGKDLAIIAATNDGAGGVVPLNRLFHRRRMERDNSGWEVKGFHGSRFAPGEPVIHGRNDYEAGLANGSIGVVAEIDEDAGSLVARFDGLEHAFDADRLIDLQLAYAITCHRAQGSQAGRIILPLSRGAMVDPTWLYTAITRAEKQVILVGDRAALVEIMSRRPRHDLRCVGFSLPAEAA
jgi:exodeoxyribonuclease V alpha subunit